MSRSKSVGSVTLLIRRQFAVPRLVEPALTHADRLATRGGDVRQREQLPQEVVPTGRVQRIDRIPPLTGVRPAVGGGFEPVDGLYRRSTRAGHVMVTVCDPRPRPQHDPGGRPAPLALFRIAARVRSDTARRFLRCPFGRLRAGSCGHTTSGPGRLHWLCFARRSLPGRAGPTWHFLRLALFRGFLGWAVPLFKPKSAIRTPQCHGLPALHWLCFARWFVLGRPAGLT